MRAFSQQGAKGNQEGRSQFVPPFVVATRVSLGPMSGQLRRVRTTCFPVTPNWGALSRGLLVFVFFLGGGGVLELETRLDKASRCFQTIGEGGLKDHWKPNTSSEPQDAAVVKRLGHILWHVADELLETVAA